MLTPFPGSHERQRQAEHQGLRGMKLRPIGNSVGTVFSKDVLQRSGLAEGDELVADVAPGEIRLRRAGNSLMLPITEDEAKAIAGGKPGGKVWNSVVAKARKLVPN